MPILYSFRRCPYAMRARMALIKSGIALEHREILLKNKPPSMLEVSPKGTVPVLVLEDGTVIDESWEIMRWAVSRNDPDNWLGEDQIYLDQAHTLIDRCDGEFKSALDHYKYADRYPLAQEEYRDQGMGLLKELDQRLAQQHNLLADRITIADIAIMPFVRQFANVDLTWFNQCGLNHLSRWLDELAHSVLFETAMQKHPLWQFEYA